MHRSLRNFFVATLLLMFLYNISGLGICIEHSRHSSSQLTKTKESTKEKGVSFSQDDECQCALHMHMNHVLLPEPLAIELPINTVINNEMPQPKAINYRCLLDYFSSRAPPSHVYCIA